jgi:hypothetical protein
MFKFEFHDFVDIIFIVDPHSITKHIILDFIRFDNEYCLTCSEEDIVGVDDV